MNKPHIGIVTFHRAVNYGAVLQAYALQKTISKLGCDCDIIDYRNTRLEERHHKNSLFKCRTPKDFARFFLRPKTRNPKYKKFKKFRENHLSLSKPCLTREELSILTNRYDVFLLVATKFGTTTSQGLTVPIFWILLKTRKKETPMQQASELRQYLRNIKSSINII